MLGRRAVLLAASLAAGRARAQDWPPRGGIRILVGYPAGGANDIVARAVAQHLQDGLGVPVVVENRSGAAGSIAAAAAARAPTDGSLLYMMSSAQVLAPAVRRNLDYDPVRDFAPITLAATAPYLFVVHPALPVATLAEFVALAKRQPGQIAYASSGVGAGPHLAMELFCSLAGIRLSHVPYRGDADALVDLTAGRVQAYLAAVGAGLPHVRSGALRALAVSSSRRSGLVPDLPTMAEAAHLPGYGIAPWWGLVGPAALPRSIVARLEGVLQPFIAAPGTRERFAALGFEPDPKGAAEFGAFLLAERDRFADAARRAGLQPA